MTASNMNRDRLEHLQAVISSDIKAGLYHGVVMKIARGGVVALDVAIGAEDAAQSKPLKSNSVFSIFSITKAFTNLLTLQAIEQGRFALTTSSWFVWCGMTSRGSPVSPRSRSRRW